MKRMLFIAAVAAMAIFAGCKEEYAIPVVSAPGSQNVEINKSVDLSFGFTADAGYKSSTLTATGGTAVIKTDASSGEITGNVVVTFTAASNVGAGAVTLTLSDNEGQIETATAVLSIYEEGAPIISAPANTEVVQTKSTDISFSFTSEGGYNSATLQATGGTAVIKTDPAEGANSGNVVITFTADRTTGAGSVVITMKDSNNKTGVATAVLNITEWPTISVTQSITANTTWETGKIYILEGRITVVADVTLTIEPGVVVKGREGAESNATALMIARGGKLIAEGTADSPIIFTSVTDKILPGEIASPTMSSSVNGLWGGLLILGKAPISAEAEAMQIEGIPPSDLNGLYGGSVPDDNSGSLKYISIRHGGTNIGEGNEINGLTLGGVGSGTIIENIEIVANQDDGIEWFGGTVNVKNVIVWNTGDDAIDTDQSWAGTLDNFIIVNPGDECFELDGPEGTLAAKHTLKNGSVYADNAQGIADLDDSSPLAASDSWVDMTGIYFFGLKAGQVFDKVPTYYTCTFSNFEATLPAGSVLTDFFKDGSDVFTMAVNEGANTVGADVTAFSGWSWAAVSGSLTGF
ncbi:MAG: hypothetical protein JXR66_11755 [Bacteroidales bacterium]|nr:hypothetical protein [Bacteroidales bacterium]